MVSISPIRGLLPKPELAGQICELPYDVMSSEEARAMANGNPWSFLHVSKPEIDLPPGTDPHEAKVYQQGRHRFQELIRRGALVHAETPTYYLYRQTSAAHSQLGLVARASCDDYRNGTIKKHELTRPDKEEDRVRHIETLEAQTGPAFLFYRSEAGFEALLESHSRNLPLYADFVAPDGVRHACWILPREAGPEIKAFFAQLSCLYIADGHHRSAAAERVSRSHSADSPAAGFLSVIFPHRQLRILPYNRALRDLNGHSEAQLLAKLERVFEIRNPGVAQPAGQHEVALYLGKKWRSLRFRPELVATDDPFEKLDVTLLQKQVLAPLFQIEDPRTSTRVNFIGGIRGTSELEKLVNSGEYACAFSMFPTAIEELMAIADRDRVMPPKSTWFEPKLRDGMFCHLLGA